MKMFLILIFTLASLTIHADSNSTALRRSNGLLRFLMQQKVLRNYALETIIGYRCSHYLSYRDAEPCRVAVNRMLQILDYDILVPPANNSAPQSFIFIAFKTNLINLLSHPKTTQYLEFLNQELYRYITGKGARPNIWEITRKYFITPHETAMAIAALFQDTSIMKLHLAYLERAKIQGRLSFQSNKLLLSRVIDSINMILDISEENYRELFYPEAIYKNLNRNIYHFYVPLYLSMALVQEKFSAQASYEASLFLTLAYEFITAANDYRYLFYDPERIEDTNKLKDMYGGYCGSIFGIRGMRSFLSYSDLKESFSRSTVDGVQLLLVRDSF